MSIENNESIEKGIREKKLKKLMNAYNFLREPDLRKRTPEETAEWLVKRNKERRREENYEKARQHKFRSRPLSPRKRVPGSFGSKSGG